jgi:quinoprotein dehydrogenase-associated probable ABC transporter substrate-binding protein
MTRTAARCPLLAATLALAAAAGAVAASTTIRAQPAPPPVTNAAPAQGRTQGQGQAPFELVDPKVFRVCGDPRNLPFSDEQGRGFENKLAELFAKALGKSVAYTWYPNAPGFVRRTLAIYKCDVIMGMPQGDDIVQVTNPYYRTAYTLVFKPGTGLDNVDTLTDPRLKDKHIGIIAGTPPATNMVLDGLIAKSKPYPLVIDTRYDSSAAAMIKDIVDGNIDAGVLWGPLAGYYAKQSKTPLTVVPLLKEKNGSRMTYRIGMGVRYSDQNWKRELNNMIRSRQAEITSLLLGYGVPLLDDNDNVITAASMTK